MSKKILIIDDEKELCEEMAHYLNDCGYLAYRAHDGQEGLAMIEKILPSLLILDIRMPGMDGLQVMRALLKKFPNLVVIVMSGHYDPDIARKAISYGAAEYLTKPIRIENLEERYIRPILNAV